MTNEEREDLEVKLRLVWNQCLVARDSAQLGMEMITKLKNDLLSKQLAELKKKAKGE